jgi:hypothetical protein
MTTEFMNATIEKEAGSEAPSLEQQRPERYPVWMWWNLLSLDAPTVVCVWALLFMKGLHIPFQPWEIAALTLAVWIIYISDRILDGLCKPELVISSDRHQFYARHGLGILRGLPPVILIAGWIGLARLGAETRFAGLVMSAAVIFYFLCIHGNTDRIHRWFPKEIVAGAIFAGGAAIPAWIHGGAVRNALLPQMLLFAGLCALNCIAIESWEHNRGERQWRKRPYWLIRLADTRIEMIAAVLILCACSIAFIVSRNGIRADSAAASIISLLILMAIERRSNHLSPQAMRVLADAALLTPVVFLLRS